MVRCFVAVDVTPEIREGISSLQSMVAEPGLKLVEPQNLHITLKFLGEVPDSKVSEIIKQLGGVEKKGFEIEVVGMGAFPNINYIRVVWLGIISDGIAKLAKDVDERLFEFPKKEEFAGHLTIARVRSKPERLREVILQNKDVFVGRQVVDRFCLKRSILLSTGPVYEPLAEFELVG